MVNNEDPHYDTIVIGSGIGGMTAAALLSQVFGEKVLLLEQHNILGGFTHTFRRGKYEWDTGLHYVGAMSSNDFPRKLLDFLTNRQVQWHKLLDPFDTFHFPNVKFEQRAGIENQIEDLGKLFPNEGLAIQKYFKILQRARLWGNLQFAALILPSALAWIPRVLSWPLRKYGRMTLAEGFDSLGISSPLSAALAGCCGNYGLAPVDASLFVHSMLVAHYANGGYYPEGGSRTLPQAFKESFDQTGVDVRLGQRVESIVVENGRVTGVRCQSRSKTYNYRATKVLSTVGARQTFLKLLSAETPIPFRNALQEFPKGMTMACVYLGLRESPQRFGFTGGNHWLFASEDFQVMMKKHEQLPEGEIMGCFLSFPSLKVQKADGPHTAEILIPLNYEAFADPDGKGWRKRGADYEAKKKMLAEKALKFVDGKFPGFTELIEFVEVSTPLSIEHFTLHRDGQVYGLPATPDLYRQQWRGPRTPVRGLFLGGADVLAHGIVGAMSGGLVAVTAMHGARGTYRIFRDVLKPS